MKLKLISAALILTMSFANGQGTFVYDQQSTNLIEGSAAIYNLGQPLGQSFTPVLSQLGFVQLNLFHSDALNHSGATLYVNLRSDAITGPILSSSMAVFRPDAFFGLTDFVFSSPVNVAPNATYYLQPVIQSGDMFSSYVTDGSYAGGTAIYQGVPIPDRDFWFREGIVVPEPSIALLVLFGGSLVVLFRRKDPSGKQASLAPKLFHRALGYRDNKLRHPQDHASRDIPSRF